MKIKTKKTIQKRYSLSKPKHGTPKVEFVTPGFTKKITKKRKFRVFRGKLGKTLNNAAQARKITKVLS